MFVIDGVGQPSAADFTLATVMLRAAATVLRSRTRRGARRVPRADVLECRWWTGLAPPPEQLPRAFAERTGWHWQQMIATGDLASDADCEAAIDEAAMRAGWRARLFDWPG